ncbi:8712_t:CDS:2 [Entrophospora sp. SA101]|nr:8712_t:CDS:2 [Entrophospora sp. SA101]
MSSSSKETQQDLTATIQKQTQQKSSGSSRSEKLNQILEKCLSETIDNFTYEKVSGCFPTLANNKPKRLEAAHKQVTTFLRKVSEKEINSILENHKVLKKLDELDEMINESKKSNNSFPSNEEIMTPQSSIRAKTLPTKQEELRRLENEFLKINNENVSLCLEIESIQEQSESKINSLKNLIEPSKQIKPNYTAYFLFLNEKMSKTTTEKIFGLPLKYVSLITLCVQNSALVIVMRYSRLDQDKSTLYFTSTAVFLSELTKLIICLCMALDNQIEERGYWSLRVLYDDVFAPDAWKLAIPAILYTIQNNLQYIAVSLLDAATFQVTYQLKILTTALCSVIMLNTSLSGMKWFSLVLLTFGVTLVQFKYDSDSASKEDENVIVERILGLSAVAIACVISGIAGVYFEKVLKGSKASVWIRNVQLSFFSLFPALILGVWWKDGDGVWEKGFFYGYNSTVVGAIACQAIGGIIVAMVVKYADNILKGFATSISIILSFIASVYLFDFIVTSTFLVGSTFVLIATYLYSKPDQPVQPKQNTDGGNNNNDSTVSTIPVVNTDEKTVSK